MYKECNCSDRASVPVEDRPCRYCNDQKSQWCSTCLVAHELKCADRIIAELDDALAKAMYWWEWHSSWEGEPTKDQATYEEADGSRSEIGDYQVIRRVIEALPAHQTKLKAEFHANRQMFVIMAEDNMVPSVVFATKGIPGTHSDWFKAIGMSKDTVETRVRGYIDSTGIYFYIGEDFRGGDKVWNHALKVLELFRQAGVPKGTPLFAGVIPQKRFGRWPPKEKMGEL